RGVFFYPAEPFAPGRGAKVAGSCRTAKRFAIFFSFSFTPLRALPALAAGSGCKGKETFSIRNEKRRFFSAFLPPRRPAAGAGGKGTKPFAFSKRLCEVFFSPSRKRNLC
ncbi:hypothetical protein, partial [Pontibacter saemangeumensis]|uniref:hypothetical protein n=1 Tax=Pontibacter saemangeumensis TaxID=1084525 RepID=UPI0031E89066